MHNKSVIAELMGVHPETLRVWERHGLLKPPRRNAQRLYTDDDLKRLSCIRGLLGKGLNLAGVAYHLIFYPAGSMTIVRSACGSPPGRDVLSHVGRKTVLFARSRLKSRIYVTGVSIRPGVLEDGSEQKKLEGEKSF